ncbi:hypothetical protein AAG570_005052 [Ranatra chinensis]|uniref:Carboxylic ester hydrolase n=1 Tax=Ranatra chinensis TaxID=642074 RepID=A0ABD0Y0Y6_9HEMI
MGGLKMPVMVYMHEGGFHFGGGSTFHGPQFFMDRNVVLVMFNYRLGAHGFLSFEDDWLPGNYGLKDQLMALKWVQANIENFGGDPKSVTIFGQSAGGSSVHYHMISTKSRGLFSRAIVQSGNAMSPWALIPKGLARSRAILASERLGCPTDGRTTDDLLGCLRNVTARDLAAVHESFLVSGKHHEWGGGGGDGQTSATLLQVPYPMVMLPRASTTSISNKSR